MTKTSRDHMIPLNVSVDPETKYKILALAYLRGTNEKITRLARDILYKGVAVELEALGEAERAEFEEILRNVRLRDVMEHLQT